MGTNFLLAPIYSSYISPSEYGIIALATIFQYFLVVFITLGLDGAFARIYFDYHKKESLVNALMSTTLLMIIFMAGLIYVFLSFVGDFLFSLALQNEKFTYSKYGYIIFFTTISTAIHSVFLSYYRNKEESLKFALVSLSMFFTSVTGIVIGVIYFRAEAMGNILGKAVGTTLVVVILLILFYGKNKITFKYKYLKNSLHYSIPLVPYLLLMTLYGSLDRIMTERYFTLETLGLYNFAFLLASTISVFIYAVFNAVSPRIYKLLAEGKNDSSETKRIIIVFHLLVVAVICFAIASIIPALRILIAESYQEIDKFISVLMVVYIFQLLFMIYTIPLFFHKKTNALPWISLTVLFIGVASNLLLIPLLGIYGVCLSLFVIKLSQLSITYLLLRKFNYHREKYLLPVRSHILSAAVIISYGVIFVLNTIYQCFDIYIINLIPLMVMTFIVILLFNNDKVFLKKMIMGKLN